METACEDNEGQSKKKMSNVIPVWGNVSSMNLNPMLLTNIQTSQYFKGALLEKKTYHELIDEIYYEVKHLEPWEKGSRRTQGQTGMCGGVRGVGAGGIVSTAFCILYKLYTLRLTRKQLMGMCNHADSPYIRGLGFMYIRYTQPPGSLFDWYESYLEDEEEIDVKAGTGCVMTIGDMLRQWLTRLEWFDTLFPRIPVPIEKKIHEQLRDYDKRNNRTPAAPSQPPEQRHPPEREAQRPRDKRSSPPEVSAAFASENPRDQPRPRDKRRSRTRSRSRGRSRSRSRSRDKEHRHRHRSGSRDRHYYRRREESSFERELRHERERQRRERGRDDRRKDK